MERGQAEGFLSEPTLDSLSSKTSHGESYQRRKSLDFSQEQLAALAKENKQIVTSPKPSSPPHAHTLLSLSLSYTPS